jgi:2-dehydropantoate 2-reductase
MKILTVGTGIIGILYGWALSETGLDVTHYVRVGRKDQYPDGVTLDLLDERKGHPRYQSAQYRLKCVEDLTPSDGYDLILIPTLTHQAEAVLREIFPKAGKADFLLFTGNWEGMAFLDPMMPRDRYLLGYADGGGTIRDNRYWTNLGGEVHLGKPEGASSDLLERVKTLFARADIQADVQDNMLHWLWQHIAGVAGFSAGFAKYRDVPRFLQDRELMRQCILSTRELYAMCRLRGVELKQYPETGILHLPVWLVSALLRWNIRRNESMQRYSAHASSESNFRETKAYYAGILKTAEELDFPLPYTRTLGEYLDRG